MGVRVQCVVVDMGCAGPGGVCERDSGCVGVRVGVSVRLGVWA